MTATLVLLALLAPAPLKPAKKAAPAIEPGTYVMTWKGIDAETMFAQPRSPGLAGFYACHWQGRWWHGRWWQEGSAVHVWEHPMDQPEAVGKWVIDLACPLSGHMRDGPAWKLRKIAAGKVG